ncbi:TPA: pyridoxal-phosphate dependent enzyme [Candidatus Woesearchaeota archaeon]|nr:pyridoxal-phosphate dependent enzyme [Candidatus Woesearchaeota archaeon]
MQASDRTTAKVGFVSHLECLHCGEKYPLSRLKEEQGTILINICYDMCMGPLDIRYDYDRLKRVLSREQIARRPDTFWKLRELLPVQEVKVAADRQFTPLVKSRAIGRELGIELYLKLDCDSANPTHSFKDRPVALAFNKALEAGYDTVYVASTGNLAIASAYQASESGIAIHAYVPEALGRVKKEAIRKHLADPGGLAELPLSYDDCNIRSMLDCDKANEDAARAGRPRSNFVPNNSFRPYYKEGSKTSGFEIALQLEKEGVTGRFHLVYPLGSGALFCSAHKGIRELQQLGLTSLSPRMWGVQPELCSPIIDAIGKDDFVPVKNPKTIAKSIAIGKPGSGHQAIAVMKESNGGGLKVTEKDIVRSNIDLYQKEGIFAQFVGGVTIAGIRKAVKLGIFKPGDVVVANITGTGKGRIEDDLLDASKEFGWEDEAKQLLEEMSHD